MMAGFPRRPCRCKWKGAAWFVPPSHTPTSSTASRRSYVASSLYIEKSDCLLGLACFVEVSQLRASEEIILQNLFGKAKGKQVKIPGFPDFGAAVADLNAVHSLESKSDYEYQVTLCLGNQLIVLQAFETQFQKSSLAPEFLKILETHDAEFNKEHQKSGQTRQQSEVKVETNRSPKKLSKTYEDVQTFRDKHKQ